MFAVISFILLDIPVRELDGATALTLFIRDSNVWAAATASAKLCCAWFRLDCIASGDLLSTKPSAAVIPSSAVSSDCLI
ncbi:hypothetical protein D3C72_1115430 [compost metagenome]